MIKIINNEQVNINQNLRKKYTLRKIAATLSVSSILFTLPSCGKDTTFNYDQNSQVSYEKQLENALGTEIELRDDVEQAFANYDIAYDNYTDLMKSKNSNVIDQVEARVELVSATREMADKAKTLLNDQARSALQVSDDVSLDIRREEEIGDYVRVMEDGEITIYTGVPDEINPIMNDLEELSIYKGTGENSAWDKEIKDYNKTAQRLYNNAINSITEDYDFDHLKKNKTR